MKTPSIQQLSPHDREAAQFAARTLQEHGFRAWIVGGGVRDLALGITPKDIDLATDALPGQVEEIFDRTIPVGKAFGTIVALIEVGGAEPVTMQLEVTTLRRDGDYSDGRRPDVVLYGTSMDEDAQRRDFTCNALYLDPLTDEISDVVGGLGDLENGVLRTVGDPVGRFREDGLRLLRMARFAAAYGLEIEGDTWAGARDSLDALVGISRERVLAELSGIAIRPNPYRAVQLLGESGVLERILPGLEGLRSNAEQAGAGVQGGGVEARLTLIRNLGDAPGVVPFLAALLSPRDDQMVELLASLRPSRATSDGVKAIWAAVHCLQKLSELGTIDGSAWRDRAALIELARTPAFGQGLNHLRGSEPGVDSIARLGALEDRAVALTPGELNPEPFLSSKDLGASSIPRGPRWGELLREAQLRQLGGAIQDRVAALDWLAKQA